jgi:phytanoyl-CoA hydroxylase
MIQPQLVQEFQDNGCVLVRGLFSPAEVEFYKRHYMEMRKCQHPGDFAGVESSDEDINRADPLQQYPRLIHMHRWDEVSRQWLLEERLRTCLRAFLGQDPYAVQTMLYFKPPGARGQALHQDQYYLRAQPGTCVAAWLALDPCDEENGCLQIVPATGDLPILCAVQADTTKSFTDITVPIPDGMDAEAVVMQPGDVFFFNGTLIHGSFPNSSQDRFRRSLIAHYVTGNAEQLTSYDQPVLTFDGQELWLETSEKGGACGVWVEEAGQPRIEMLPKEPVGFFAGEFDANEARRRASEPVSAP